MGGLGLSARHSNLEGLNIVPFKKDAQKTKNKKMKLCPWKSWMIPKIAQ